MYTRVKTETQESQSVQCCLQWSQIESKTYIKYLGLNIDNCLCGELVIYNILFS